MTKPVLIFNFICSSRLFQEFQNCGMQLDFNIHTARRIENIAINVVVPASPNIVNNSITFWPDFAYGIQNMHKPKQTRRVKEATPMAFEVPTLS